MYAGKDITKNEISVLDPRGSQTKTITGQDAATF